MSAIGDKADIGTYRQDIPSLLAEIRLSIDGLDNGRHRPVAFAKSLHQEGLAVAGDPFYKDHWINIDRDRLDRYERMFQWNPASSALYEPADIRPGHIVADFGCGPGYTAIEIAKWSGRAVTCMPWTSIQILSLEHARMRTQLALARGSLCTNVMVPFCLCWTSL